MNIKKVSEMVELILEECHKSRESDELLILKVWAIQNSSIRNPNFSFVRFSHDFLKGKFYSTGSIGRARRKLQEKREDLRGSNYKQRQKHQEDVKDQLKQI